MGCISCCTCGSSGSDLDIVYVLANSCMDSCIHIHVHLYMCTHAWQCAQASLQLQESLSKRIMYSILESLSDVTV